MPPIQTCGAGTALETGGRLAAARGWRRKGPGVMLYWYGFCLRVMKISGDWTEGTATQPCESTKCHRILHFRMDSKIINFIKKTGVGNGSEFSDTAEDALHSPGAAAAEPGCPLGALGWGSWESAPPRPRGDGDRVDSFQHFLQTVIEPLGEEHTAQ